MNDKIRLEQALFGYQDGHNLIASSFSLPLNVRHFLANVTDSSGPASVQNFDGACTGVPIPDTSFYSIFRTWNAPEMPRPGCVWSHVILVDLVDLAHIPDLSALLKCFIRPVSPVNLPDYQAAPYLTPHTSQSFDGISHERSKFLIELLYGKPFEDIVILDNSTQDWDRLILAVWSQQWPRLRRNFSFSTGSLGDRRSTGVSFDLQIAPIGSERLWGRGKRPPYVVTYGQLSETDKFSWTRTVIDDLFWASRSSDTISLRSFLLSYGSDVEHPRAAFPKLVEFAAQAANPDYDTVAQLSHIAAAFPEPGNALTLKRDVLRSIRTHTEALPDKIAAEQAFALTYFLIRSPEAIAFYQAAETWGPTASLLWEHKRADLLSLLGDLPQNSASSKLLQDLSDLLLPNEIPILWNDQPRVLERIISQKPSLAADCAAWDLSISGQRNLWNHLFKTTTDEKLWAKVCTAMLLAGAEVQEQKTVMLSGEHLFESLEEWLSNKMFKLPSHAWREALASVLAFRLHHSISISPALLALSGWAVPPVLARSVSTSRPDLLNLAKVEMSGIPMPLILPTYFWLVALGLSAPKSEGAVFLQNAFFPVYEAVANSKYPSDAWEIVSPILPEGPDWDRCRKLRKAMHNWLRQQPLEIVDEFENIGSRTRYSALIPYLRQSSPKL